MDRSLDFEKLFTLVERPARYVTGERGAPRLRTPEKDQLRVALVFPDLYEIGMSHLGLRVLSHLLARHRHIFVDLAFSPWIDMEQQMRKTGLPFLGHFSRIPLREFHLVGVSVQSELNFSTVLNLIDLMGMPIHAAERTGDEPLLLAGGPCVMNPEPLADFIDLFLVGDGEEALPELADQAHRFGLHRGEPRNRFLEAAAAQPGWYNPLLPQAGGVHRRIIPTLDPGHLPPCPLVPVTGISQDRLAVEIMRGCSRGCRFCSAGYLYRPVREREAGEVVDAVIGGLDRSGWEEVGLLSLSSSDHSQIDEIIERLNRHLVDRRVSISLPSLRADRFSVDLARQVKQVKRSGFTFAPEAGTERLRNIINKNLSKDELLETVQTAYSEGWDLIKLYFMVGLPGETDEDLEGIVRLCREISHLGKRGRGRRRSGRAKISLSPFVPKAHTPFQWAGFDEVAELHRKISALRRPVERIPGLSVRWRDPELSWVEATLARGDRSMGRVLEAAWRAGAGLETWSERFSHQSWVKAFEEAKVDPAGMLGPRSLEESLPWHTVRSGMSESFLKREWERSLRGDVTPDCRTDGCHGCGLTAEQCPMYADRQPGKEPDAAASASFPPAGGGPNAASGPEQRPPFAPLRDGAPGPDIPVHRYRIEYEKTRAARFLSHLDLKRSIERAIRASGLRPDYSRGFSPQPRFSFAPPLPLGYQGRSEFFECRFLDPLEPGAAAVAINGNLPNGLCVTRILSFQTSRESILNRLCAAVYEIHGVWREERRTASEPVNPSLIEVIESFDRRDSWVVERQGKKGKLREVDLKMAVLSMGVKNGDAGEVVTLCLRLGNEPEVQAPVKAILQTVFELSPESQSELEVIRTGFEWSGEEH